MVRASNRHEPLNDNPILFETVTGLMRAAEI
jgi:hypothetical protein